MKTCTCHRLATCTDPHGQSSTLGDETSNGRVLHAYLSNAAHEQWHKAAERRGVSVSELLEAAASLLDPRRTSEQIAATVERARAIDLARRNPDWGSR